MIAHTAWSQLPLSNQAILAVILTALTLAVAILLSALAQATGMRKQVPSQTIALLLDVSTPAGEVLLYRVPDGRCAVCVCTSDGDGWSFAAVDAVSIAADLSSARLAPTPIPLMEWDEVGCTNVGDVMVALWFAGTGELTHAQSCFRSPTDGTVMGRSTDVARRGIATLILNGQVHRAEACLTRSTDTFRGHG